MMLRPKEVVCKWVDAFNDHDVEAIVSLYHDNTVRVDVDLANGALGGTAQLLLRNADGILQRTAVRIDDMQDVYKRQTPDAAEYNGP